MRTLFTLALLAHNHYIDPCGAPFTYRDGCFTASGNNLEEMPLLGDTPQLELLEVQKNRISVMRDEYFSKMPALKR